MTGRAYFAVNLTNAEWRQRFLLTLATLFLLLTRLSHADPLPATVSDEATKQRVSEVTSYLRTQSLHTLLMLPSEVRETMGYFSGDWHTMKMGGGDDDAPEPDMTLPQNLTAPVEDDTSFGISSHFHHKGFLPTHDAMMMGAEAKQNLVDNKLSLTMRPFVGQGCLSLRDYYGAETALAIARHPDGLPWGKIAIGYIGGKEELTDHGTGMEAHGDIDLTGGFNFTTGLRQNSDTGSSNYMMVKWKLTFE